MNIFIYGFGKCGKYIYKKIKDHKSSQIKVTGCIDKNKHQITTELPCFTIDEFLQLDKAEIDAVVVASTDDALINEMVLALKKGGYEDIYVVKNKSAIWKNEVLDCDGKFSQQITYFKNVKPVIRYIDFMIVEHCNLNCRRCSFFSNIAKEQYADISLFKNIVSGLKNKFSNILFFVLLGGEPLLNPCLSEYIGIVGNSFPRTNLKVTTNGLLIENMPQKLIDALKEYKVTLRISQYPPTTKIKKQIVDFLTEKEIQYFFTEPIMSFDKFICDGTEDPKVAFEANCSKVRCPEIYDGRLYNCSLIPAIYKNQQFLGLSLSKEEIEQVSFDLLNGHEDGWTILEKMNRCNKLCRYCTTPERVEWSNVGVHCKEDYLVDIRKVHKKL